MIPKFRAWNIESKEMLEHDFIVETVMWGGDIVRDFSDVINGEDVFILMQSTGLHDVNGKEIFEGDIVQCWYEKGFVTMRQGSWIIETNKEYLGALYEYSDEARVIGNIHENPGLLEGDDKCM